ncbi:hypothetical protein ACA910_007856 [Epithemia clementina (nom. ined.)]
MVHVQSPTTIITPFGGGSRPAKFRNLARLAAFPNRRVQVIFMSPGMQRPQQNQSHVVVVVVVPPRRKTNPSHHKKNHPTKPQPDQHHHHHQQQQRQEVIHWTVECLVYHDDTHDNTNDHNHHGNQPHDAQTQPNGDATLTQTSSSSSSSSPLPSSTETTSIQASSKNQRSSPFAQSKRPACFYKFCTLLSEEAVVQTELRRVLHQRHRQLVLCQATTRDRLPLEQFLSSSHSYYELLLEVRTPQPKFRVVRGGGGGDDQSTLRLALQDSTILEFPTFHWIPRHWMQQTPQHWPCLMTPLVTTETDESTTGKTTTAAVAAATHDAEPTKNEKETTTESKDSTEPKETGEGSN